MQYLILSKLVSSSVWVSLILGYGVDNHIFFLLSNPSKGYKMTKIIQFVANKAYWTTAVVAHICAKIKLAWDQYYTPERPGTWGE